MVKSYTTSGLPLLQIAKNGFHQLRALRSLRNRVEELVATDLSTFADFTLRAESLLERSATGLHVLEVGHGQFPRLLAYIAALGNEAVGIDTDVLPATLYDLAGYAKLLWKNGLVRTAKTFARQLSGINQSYRSEFIRSLQLTGWPDVRLITKDALDTGFPNSHFDLVFSFNVFEHLSDPPRVIEELKRVVKPGGCLMLAFPHYAHPNALHDLRYTTGAPKAPPPWAHLIPGEACLVQQGAFVNHIRLDAWKDLFSHLCPGVEFRHKTFESPTLFTHLHNCRNRGWLVDYSDEELLTELLMVDYRKPM